MPPPGYEPFLRAICENPEDDTVRLVYADWLDENGDPDRAEFIRLQIACSKTDFNTEQKTVLRKRVTDMIKLHQERWLGEFPQDGIYWDSVYDDDNYLAGPFQRGFPVGVAIPHGPNFSEHAAKIFSLAPIEQLILPQGSLEQIRESLMCPFIGGIRSFLIRRSNVIGTARGWVGDELCAVLSQLTHLRCLEALCLIREGITDTGAAALATAEFLPRLRDVWLRENLLSEDAVLRITDRFLPDRIRRLYLPNESLQEETRQVLQQRFGDRVSFH